MIRTNLYKDFYIESLTAGVWTLRVFPYLLKERLRSLHRIRTIFYMAGTPWGIFWARLMVWLISARLEELEYSWIDMRDEKGDSRFLTVMFEDLPILQKNIKNTPDYKSICKNATEPKRLPLCLSKQIMHYDRQGREFLLSVLCKIYVVLWKDKQSSETASEVYFFMNQRPWLTEIEKHFSSKNLIILPVINFSDAVKRWFSRCEKIKFIIKQILYYWMAIRGRLDRAIAQRHKISEKFQNQAQRFCDPNPCMAVEYYGHLNLDSPELFSDLFFYQRANLSAKDILVYFNLPNYPATHKKWIEIKEKGMEAVAINPLAAQTPDIPLFHYLGKTPELKIRKISSNGNINQKWLREQITYYHQRYDYWLKFVTSRNIKIHVCWYKFDPWYFALEDVLENTGGVSIIYQRSFEDLYHPWLVSSADVVFGFSDLGGRILQDSDSTIPYYVITGFLGDHRNELVKERSNKFRAQLRRSGAEQIIAYFDENSGQGNRVGVVDHKTTIENYTFLLEKVLQNRWLGLVLKPKVPATLRKRLGDTAKLLRQAEETGRCLVIGEGPFQNSWSPAAAFQAADIAIHGHFYSGTAGFESVLAGKCTLFLDREGWSRSLLYQLGDEIIFKNWDDLWSACEQCWESPSKAEQLRQCWAEHMDMLDPFRDGCAAQRMGTYLGWLMEGFKAKLTRETVLADAAERYMKLWGRDKILSVNCSTQKEYAGV